MSSVQTTSTVITDIKETVETKEFANCKQLLKSAKRPIVALFANPNLRKFGMLPIGTGNDMRNFIQDISPFDFHMEPATTFEQMEAALAQNCPQVICFFGHGFRNGIALEVAETRSTLLPSERPISPFQDHQNVNVIYAEQFTKSILANCSATEPPLKCIALFACETGGFAKKLKDKFPNVYIIYWETIVMDEASQLFARGFTASIATQIQDGFSSIPKAFDAGCSTLINSLCSFEPDIKCKIGDPQLYRNMTALHYSKIIEDLELAKAKNYPISQVQYRMNKFIPECEHCVPPVHGIPAMFTPNTKDPIHSSSFESNTSFRPIDLPP